MSIFKPSLFVSEGGELNKRCLWLFRLFVFRLRPRNKLTLRHQSIQQVLQVEIRFHTHIIH